MSTSTVNNFDYQYEVRKNLINILLMNLFLVFHLQLNRLANEKTRLEVIGGPARGREGAIAPPEKFFEGQ
jgi:hypothetical protein